MMDRSFIIRKQDEDLTAPARPASPGENSEPGWLTSVRGAQAKKAQDIIVLDLREITSLTDFFIICTGTNTRQNQAISDEVYSQLKSLGDLPVSYEGYDNAEWVLLDYSDFIVHIFTERTRSYYDLERLWRHARRVEVPPEHVAA